MSGANFAKRPTDGRILRSERSRAALAERVLEAVVQQEGTFQPKLAHVIEASARSKTEVGRLFGSHRHVMRRIARTKPAAVVDAIGLSPEARATLSERDERAIAWAVLAGRRLERGA